MSMLSVLTLFFALLFGNRRFGMRPGRILIEYLFCIDYAMPDAGLNVYAVFADIIFRTTFRGCDSGHTQA